MNSQAGRQARPNERRVSRLEDEMHMTEVETHKARKAHRCTWCWQWIDEAIDQAMEEANK